MKAIDETVAESTLPASPSPLGRSLRSAVARLPWRGVLRWLVGTLVVGWLIFAALILALRYVVLPDIGRYQTEIEQEVSAVIGLPVRIGSVSAGWDGLRPELRLEQVRVFDRKGKEALSFQRVEAALSWRSVAQLDLSLHRLLAAGPTLEAERLADGRIFVAGFQVYPSHGGDPALADWLLKQKEIAVTGARIRWRDALRRLPAGSDPAAQLDQLELTAVSFQLENEGRAHRFALRATPPERLAGRLDLRGDMRGSTLARLGEWQGDFYLSAPAIDLAEWRQWLPAPVQLYEGRGGVQLWGQLDGLGVIELSADLALADLRVALNRLIPGDDPQVDDGTLELDLTGFQGRVGVRRAGVEGQRLSFFDTSLQLRNGLEIPPTSFHVEWTPIPQAEGGGTWGLAVASSFDLGRLARLSAYLPLDRASRRLLQTYAPAGVLENFRLTWRGNAERLERYSLTTDFRDLGLHPDGLLPGFEGLSGKMVLDEAAGQLDIASGPLVLQFPAVFPQPRIALDALEAKVGWTIKADLLDVQLQEARFSGPDATGSARGSYRLALGEANPEVPAALASPGEINLTAHISEADGTAVWRYLPHLIGADVRHWVRDAVREGRVTSADLILRGPLAEFPFPDNAAGQFLVRADVVDGRLIYAPGWPEISGIKTELRFEGAGASFAAAESTTAGVRLGKVQAGIADFAAASPLLTIVGDAEGPVPGFINFLDQSPIGEVLGRFYEDIKLSGDGKLRLGLDIPLDRPEAARVRGELDIANGRALVDPLLPPVTEFTGRVSFTEKTGQAKALSGQFFGQPVRVDLQASGNEVRVAAFGAATASALQKQYQFPLLYSLSGSLPWHAAVSVRDGRVRLEVESSLQGLTSELPGVFRKSAEQILPVRFSREPLADKPVPPLKAGKPVKSGNQVNAARAAKPLPDVPRDELRLAVGELAGATLRRRLTGEKSVVERGLVSVGEGWSSQPLPERGLRVAVTSQVIDLDQWRAAWSHGTAKGAKGATGQSATALGEATDWPTPQLDLKAKTVRLIGRQWREVAVSAKPVPGGMTGKLEARDMAGEWSWDNAGKGTLRARLKQLNLPDVSTAASVGASGAPSVLQTEKEATATPDQLPALDIVADQLVLGERRLGRLELMAENTDGSWWVPQFLLSSADGRISGSGLWTPAGPKLAPATQVEFKVEASDIGKLLARFGYPDAVQRGEGLLSGRLSWQGAPNSIHAPSLSGALQLRAERGQFSQLKPGFGKLLSLLSLQMLPRRVTLDFRDVFSAGFAFENISGDVRVSNGVFATDNLVVEGPAAKVSMAGNADLANDRQDMRIKVQPELGTTVAVGAAVVAVNPIVGVAALVAQKLLQDPFNKLFAFEYDVTGPIADPQVVLVAKPNLAPPTPAGEAAESVPTPAASEVIRQLPMMQGGGGPGLGAPPPAGPIAPALPVPPAAEKIKVIENRK